MSAPAFEVIDTEIESNHDVSESGKKNNSSSAKLERRRRIEELNEERSMRSEWDDF
jgi:hypothetical protein